MRTAYPPSAIGEPTALIRAATAEDLSGIVTIHQQSFADFFLTRLGASFLRQYYSLVLNYRSGIVLVGESPGALRGFASGFLEPGEFYRLMWRARLTFALPVIAALFRHPSLVTRVLHGVRRIHNTASPWPEGSCELASIAVSPSSGGNGLGKALIQAFLAQARSRNARCIFLTTDADGNDAVNAFYRNVGFRHTRRFRQGEGRWMNEYVMNGLEACNPCEILP